MLSAPSGPLYVTKRHQQWSAVAAVFVSIFTQPNATSPPQPDVSLTHRKMLRPTHSKMFLVVLMLKVNFGA